MSVIPQPALIRVVVDDPDRRHELHELLVQAGFRVAQCAIPQRLMDLLHNPTALDRAELVLLQLPSATHPLEASLSLLQSWRRIDSKVALVLLSAEAPERERASLLEAGADLVLVEPVGSKELVARCKALLRQLSRTLQPLAAASDLRVLEAGGLKLFQDQCRVRADGVEVTLTPREFRLLECFMLQPGRVLSRDQLIAQVWGSDYQGKPKSVDVHVWWLRHKLERPGRPQMFLTVRGLGYRFEPPSSQ